MKTTLTAIVCLLTVLSASPALAYSRDSQGYSVTAGEADAEASAPEDAYDDDPKGAEESIVGDTGHESGGGAIGVVIGGYLLLTVGGLAAIAGSTIVAATDHNVLGASMAGGGAAASLIGTLMITLGHRSYAVGPAIDPKNGTYGVVLAKRF